MADDIDVDNMLEDFLEAPESKTEVKEEKMDESSDESNKKKKRRSREKDAKNGKSRKRSSRSPKKSSKRSSRDRSPRRSRKRSRERKKSEKKSKHSRSSRSPPPRRNRRTRSRSADRMLRKKSPELILDRASAEERDSRTVLAMQLSQTTKEKDLKEFFSEVGDVKAVKLIQSLSKKRQKNIGIAYIEFKYMQSVPLAIGLSGKELQGVPIMVQQSLAEKNRHAQMMEVTRQNLSKLGTGPIKLKVTNLPEEVTEDMVRQIFGPFGAIDACLLINDPITQKFTGAGFVTFNEGECGKSAMRELDRFDLAGNKLRVTVVESMDRSRSSRRSRSRSRERRRRRRSRDRSPEVSAAPIKEEKRVVKAEAEDNSTIADPANGAVGRIALMNKLANREPTHVPEPKPVSKPDPKPAAATQPIETTCFQLSNMFDPTKETEPSWDVDIRDDVILEMFKYGGCTHVYVDKHSKEGAVYVKSKTIEAAMLATKAIHGRYFDGKMIQAAYIPEANYIELFPDAATADAPVLQPK